MSDQAGYVLPVHRTYPAVQDSMHCGMCHTLWPNVRDLSTGEWWCRPCWEAFHL